MRKFSLALSLALAVALAFAGCQSGTGREAVLFLTEPGGSPNGNEIETTQSATKELEYNKIPMVMVAGKLYYDTGKESGIDARCGVMDGEITSTVDGSETPTADDQSNFGTGFGYQYGADDTIEIFMNEKWIVFEHRAGSGSQVRFGSRWIDQDNLSEETLEWIAWYNSLSEEEQLAVSDIPADLLDASGISAVDDAEASA